MDKLFLSLITLVLISLVALTIYNSMQHSQPIIIHQNKQYDQPPPITPNQYILNKSVSRLVNPLLPPERTPANGPVPISVPTRGYPSEYQQVGVLKPQEDAPATFLTGQTLLPLFGRPSYPGSNQWNYYSGNDTLATIKLPVVRDGADCLSNNGCKELYDNDSVQVKGLPGTYNVQLYQLDAPRYYP